MLLRALPLALSAATRDLRGMYRRTRRNAVLSVLAGLSFGIAFLAALFAAGAWLAPVYGPAGAALIIAGSMAGLGIALILSQQVLKYIDRRRHRRSGTAQRLSAAAAISVLPHLTKSKSLLVVAALGGLAYLAAQSYGEEE